MSEVRVLAAVIQQDGKFLVCQRPQTKRHGGLWEFPGGKLEAGETLLDAAVRELREELDLQVDGVGEAIFINRDPHSPFVIEFVPAAVSGSPRCLEHSDLLWSSLEDMQHLDLAPSDRRFVDFMSRDD